jgi:general secretion pathway protein M
MSSVPTFTRSLGRSPVIAVALYAMVVGGFITTAYFSISDTLDHVSTLTQTSNLLDQIRDRQAHRSPATPSSGRAASPFLEGTTVTVAGAVLLQRVASAVNAAGGSIQSSQVDVTTQGKDGFVSLQITSEMEQPALQKILYDLEVGTPLLFVDQLDVQVPQAVATNDRSTGRIRVVLGVSGQWQDGK